MTKLAVQLSIRLLDAPEVQIAESPLVLNNQKARALLYYLAATGQPHTRDPRHLTLEGNTLAETYEMFGALLHLSSTQGELSLYLGEWDAASEAFQRGLALAEELSNLERQAGYRAGLALVARGRGDEASLLAAPTSPSGRALLAQAHTTLAAHQAQAELKALKPLLAR